MSFDGIAINDLIRILASGAILELNAHGRPINDLVRLAAAASNGGGLTLTGVGGLATNDLVRIGAAGSGKVTLRW